MNKQAGLSLSEVLISLLLTSIIMTTLIQLYMGIKAQYIEVENILATRFDLQWVSDLVSDSVRRAGFTPCLGLDQLEVIDRRNNHRTIHALHVENHPHSFIEVNRMDVHFAKIIKIQSTTRLIVESSLPLNKKHPVLIADCEHAEVHDVDHVLPLVNKTLITLKKPLVFSYTTSAYLGEFLEERWFIKKNATGNNSLYYQSGQAEEVTPLIHSLQIKKQQDGHRVFLEVIMGLDEDKSHKIQVLVRGS